MAEFEIEITTTPDGAATLQWDGAGPAESLERAVAAAAADALIGRGLRRVEVARPADDQPGRRALLSAGFRQEGIRRQAVAGSAGDLVDVIIYGRLASDQVEGPSAFSGVVNSTMPRKRLIAHAVFRDEAGRVLLCQTTFKTDWELPGGIVEPFESPRDGAIREIREELGVDRTVGRLLVVDWLPPYLGWDDACELIFDGGTIDESELDRYELDRREIMTVRLCTLAEAGELMTESAHRRLTVACTVDPGETAYTEHGRRI